jgi:phage terminase Nu1 subunit (DNA packaging protein)
MKTKKPETVTATAMAALLQIDRALVGRMAADGILPRGADGRFDPIAAMSAYIKHLRTKARERSQSAAHSILQEARAEEIRLRTAERLRELIEMTDALAAIDSTFGTIKSEMSGIPARVTRDLSMRRTIEKELDGVLSRAAARLEKAAAALESGADPLDDNRAPATRRKMRRSTNAQSSKD